MSGRPVNIEPRQANQLVQALKHEIELAKAAGAGTEESQQHYAKADSIKKILLSYQAQQKAKQQQESNMNMGMGQSPSPNVGTPMMAGSPAPRSFTPMRQGSPVGTTQSQPMAPTNSGGSAGSGTPSLPASAITVENFNQVKTKLQDFERKIQQLLAQKKGYLNPEQSTALDTQITELRGKYSRYQKFAYYMKGELLKQQGQQSQPTTNNMTSSQSMSNVPVAGNSSAVTNTNTAPVPTTGGPTMSGATVNAGPVSTATSASTPAPGAAGLAATNASLETKPKSPSPDRVNLSGITKTSVPSLPISSSINVKPPNPITLKPNGGVRPTLTGGYSTSMGQVLNQPSVKLPNYEIANNASMPEGNRVLSKRKLSELINTIGADEGDGKTVVDGDVEELLLDLADEFITSVTGFACRLAKHRKVDSIDVKDIQLHLEKNWNIRIPGYSVDEIKNVKRLVPSNSYSQKVQGVEIAKSVNDING
ncbi:transcription initiation factor TFIID subunit 12 [[Candida] jaroonii]|uniref:Transcription initiation factor TFIID subunit 12 n=1 Tax=[Candida] jaroonii TaxID=467808 RepID=A0ACA9YFS3_9ASCO|nr:transcription initiation factor TFIID subunit 12 [[Candida] jaroonii]